MKIKIGDSTYEQLKFMCGTVESYFDVLETVEENEKANGRMSKADIKLIKEFLVLAFDNQFTTEDIDKNLEFSDLIVFYRAIGEEIVNKTNSKFEKLSKK